MQCGAGDDAFLINADLFDAWPSESAAAVQLADGALLPCAFNCAALLTGAVTALLFHLVVLAQVIAVLIRLVHRFHTASSKDGWWATFSGRYSLLVVAMTTSVIAFNAVRITSLAQRPSSGGGTSPLLSLSFAPRAGGSIGASVPLFTGAVAFIGAVAFSVRNTVHAAIATSPLVSRQHALPLFIRHFTAVCLILFALNAAVWALLFVLPSAAESSMADAAQLAIALLLISLGNVSYWCLARSVTMATQRLSESLRISPAPPSSPGHGSEAQPPLHQPLPSTSHGLNQGQVERRQKQSLLFHASSVIVRVMMSMHQLVCLAFFLCCLLLPSYRLQAYWLYFAQCYWALVCSFRLQILVVPHPS